MFILEKWSQEIYCLKLRMLFWIYSCDNKILSTVALEKYGFPLLFPLLAHCGL